MFYFTTSTTRLFKTCYLYSSKKNKLPTEEQEFSALNTLELRQWYRQRTTELPKAKKKLRLLFF